MTPKCPKCGSIVYSRRNVLCGVCGERLPADLLFSASERAQVEHDLDEVNNREQAARAADEVAAEERQLSVGERVGRHHPIFGAAIRAVRAVTRRRWWIH
jgi:hypothetical protein